MDHQGGISMMTIIALVDFYDRQRSIFKTGTQSVSWLLFHKIRISLIFGMYFIIIAISYIHLDRKKLTKKIINCYHNRKQGGKNSKILR